jgi:hypothetical protein
VAEERLKIVKPQESKLARFKSNRTDAPAGVQTLPETLKVMKLSETNDFVMVHPDSNNYQSTELCFISVPVQGMKNNVKHLGDQELLMSLLSDKHIERHALALATMPNDRFFLAIVPTNNLDNTWNRSTLRGIELARTHWVQLSSRRGENVDEYKIDFAADDGFVPTPKWPSLSLDDLILTAFKDRIVDHEDHPALLRKLGRKQKIDVT